MEKYSGHLILTPKGSSMLVTDITVITNRQDIDGFNHVHDVGLLLFELLNSPDRGMNRLIAFQNY